jgi:hypothetical protein
MGRNVLFGLLLTGRFFGRRTFRHQAWACRALTTVFVLLVEAFACLYSNLALKSNLHELFLHLIPRNVHGHAKLWRPLSVLCFTRRRNAGYFIEEFLKIRIAVQFFIHGVVSLFTFVLLVHFEEAFLECIDFVLLEIVEEQLVRVSGIFGATEVVVIFRNIFAFHFTDLVRNIGIILGVVLSHRCLIAPSEYRSHAGVKISVAGLNSVASIVLWLEGFQKFNLLVDE